MLGLALLIDPPLAGYRAIEADRLSLPYVAMAAFLIILAALLRPVAGALVGGSRAAVLRLAAGAAAGTVCFILWAALFPAVLTGAEGLLPPEVRAVFFDLVAEMQPMHGLADAALCLGTGALATAFALALALRRRSLLWLWVGFAGAATLALGALHLRFSLYASAFGAAALPIMLASVIRWGERQSQRPGSSHSEAYPRILRLATLLLFLVGPMLPTGLAGPAAAEEAGGADCSLRSVGQLLQPYAGQVVLTSADDAPEILYRAPVKTVGSLYHRNVPAFLRQRAAWVSQPSDQLPEAVRQTRATLVLACFQATNVADPGKPPSQTLAARLRRAEVPPWLREVAADPRSGLRLYRLSPDGA